MENSLTIQPLNKKARSSGIEILRIIAMLIIVAQHLENHTDSPDAVTVNTVWLYIMRFGGRLAVNVFVIITGYFYKSKFSTKKVFRLVGQVTFYSVVMTTVSVLCGAVEFRLMLFPRALFPFIFRGGEYWFITMYLLLFCMTPVLSPAIDKIKRRHLGMIILIFLSVWCLMPFTLGQFFKLQDFSFSNFGWFILMYLIGAFIKKTENRYDKYKKYAVMLLVVFTILVIIGRILRKVYGEFDTFTEVIVMNMEGGAMDQLMPTFISILLFVSFKDIKVSVPKWFFTVSAATFGVYLFHDNLYFHDYLWHNIMRTTDIVNSKFFIPYSLLCVIIVFVAGVIIEVARKKLLEDPFFKIKFVNSFFDKIDSWLEED